MFVWTAATCLPLVISIFLLSVQISPSFSHFFTSYSFALFLIVVLLYVGCFSIKNKPVRWALGLTLTLLLLSSSLSWLWNSSYSGNEIIGGILPYKDGYFYYEGAQRLLVGQVIPLSGMQAVFEPLFSGFLSALELFTGNNLLWCLAIVTILMAIGGTMAAWQIAERHHALTAAIFMTLLLFYAQLFVGYPWTELTGLAFGCVGFVLLWNGAERLKLWDVAVGIAVLTIGISIRAGTFFILPLLVFWTGWAFRGTKRFAIKPAVIIFAVTTTCFILANIVYPRLMTAPGASTFGNLAGTLYGQAVGGAGYQAAVKTLGTGDPAIVYQAVLERIRDYPLGMVIGVAKSYRDMFLLNSKGFFNFIWFSRQQTPNVVLWLIALGLLVWELAHSIRNIRDPLASFQLACFIGIFLSIPFLPPVDNGNRFYAGTMPFFFILPAMALETIPQFHHHTEKPLPDEQPFGVAASVLAICMVTLTLFVAPLIRLTSKTPQASSLTCPTNQKAFTIQVHKDSYLDVIHDGSAACGKAPEVCLADLLANGKTEVTDDFYLLIVNTVETSPEPVRVLAAVNLTDQSYSYFIGTKSDLESANSSGLVSGCAVNVPTQYQTIYQVESIIPSTSQ